MDFVFLNLVSFIFLIFHLDVEVVESYYDDITN